LLTAEVWRKELLKMSCNPLIENLHSTKKNVGSLKTSEERFLEIPDAYERVKWI